MELTKLRAVGRSQLVVLGAKLGDVGARLLSPHPRVTTPKLANSRYLRRRPIGIFFQRFSGTQNAARTYRYFLLKRDTFSGGTKQHTFGQPEHKT
jgi:hypothetical protein